MLEVLRMLWRRKGDLAVKQNDHFSVEGSTDVHALEPNLLIEVKSQSLIVFSFQLYERAREREHQWLWSGSIGEYVFVWYFRC